MSIRAATRERIEQAHRYSAFYRGYLANHLPMALVALDRMGASDAEIARFCAGYVRQLEPMPAAAASIALGDEERFIGRRDAFPAWVDYFERRVASEGAPSVLGEWADRLVTGIGTAAFHGAIRTAYALESGSRAELAHALAYWVAAFERIGVTADPSGTASPAEAMAAMSRDPDYAGRRPAGAGIAGRIASVAARPSFPAHVSQLDPRRLDLDGIADALIHAYAASGDFTILHGVTGCHAFRVIFSSSGITPNALRHLWTALTAAYASCGCPPIEGWVLDGSDRLDWPGIHRKAAACDDEHDVKFAYSCWREWQWRGDDLYRRAGSARVCHALAALAEC